MICQQVVFLQESVRKAADTACWTLSKVSCSFDFYIYMVKFILYNYRYRSNSVMCHLESLDKLPWLCFFPSI